jgi:UDPglucose--hexose-1-phosphate uridylyltransferase
MTILMRERRFDPIRNRWAIISTEHAGRPSDYLMSHSGLIIGKYVILASPSCEGPKDITPTEIFAIRESGSEPNSRGWKVRFVPNKYPAHYGEENA